MKKVGKFLNAAEGQLSLAALNEAYAALRCNPKASRKALEAVATASGKPLREVKTIFGKVFKFK